MTIMSSNQKHLNKRAVSPFLCAFFLSHKQSLIVLPSVEKTKNLLLSLNCLRRTFRDRVHYYVLKLLSPRLACLLINKGVLFSILQHLEKEDISDLTR